MSVCRYEQFQSRGLLARANLQKRIALRIKNKTQIQDAIKKAIMNRALDAVKPKDKKVAGAKDAAPKAEDKKKKK